MHSKIYTIACFYSLNVYVSPYLVETCVKQDKWYFGFTAVHPFHGLNFHMPTAKFKKMLGRI